MVLYKRSRYTVDIAINTSEEKLVALYQTMTDAFVIIPENDWFQIVNNPGGFSDLDTLEDLLDQGFLVKDDVDESTVFECWMQQHVHDYTSITSKIIVTRKCNNRCLYCILDPQATEMSPETALAMDDFYIDFLNDKRPLHVKDDYLGGEPLLNADIILASAARRFNYCREENIEYGFSITTNGTLIEQTILSKMKDVGLTDIRVSMAGPARLHDKLRPSVTNGKTYDKIINNLCSVSGLIPISIECQYDSGSMDYQLMSEMLHDFKKHDIHIKEVIFTPILTRKGESTYNSGLGNPEIALFLMQEAQIHGYAQELMTPSSICRADFRSMFVFDTDGSIIPCPCLQEGELAYGHVTKGIDFVAESQLLKRNLPDKCINQCSLLPICMGGCRQQSLVFQDDFAGIDCQYDTHYLYLKNYIREIARKALSGEEGDLSEKAT